MNEPKKQFKVIALSSFQSGNQISQNVTKQVLNSISLQQDLKVCGKETLEKFLKEK